MQAGDVITKVDGKTVTYYNQTVDMILAVETDDMTITVQRGTRRSNCI
jgi:PDZ domain-containing secreted protein